jgi:hypothetical protein
MRGIERSTERAARTNIGTSVKDAYFAGSVKPRRG